MQESKSCAFTIWRWGNGWFKVTTTAHLRIYRRNEFQKNLALQFSYFTIFKFKARIICSDLTKLKCWDSNPDRRKGSFTAGYQLQHTSNHTQKRKSKSQPKVVNRKYWTRTSDTWLIRPPL